MVHDTPFFLHDPKMCIGYGQENHGGGSELEGKDLVDVRRVCLWVIPSCFGKSEYPRPT